GPWPSRAAAGAARRRGRVRPPAPPPGGGATTGRGWSGGPPHARPASCRWPWAAGRPARPGGPSCRLPDEAAQAGAARAGVPPQLVLPGAHRLPGEEAEAVPVEGAERLLDLAV